MVILTSPVRAVKAPLYGRVMGDRLTKTDWLRHGLRTLEARGAGALTVGAMAAALGVSRGSFYWHFADAADFRAQLLGRWREVSTEHIIDALDARPGDPARLGDLLRRALTRSNALERAVRAWAAHDSAVAEAVAAVDGRRIEGLTHLLVEGGVEAARAADRALFLYWAFLGRTAVVGDGHAVLPDAALADVAALFATEPAVRPDPSPAGPAPR